MTNRLVLTDGPPEPRADGVRALRRFLPLPGEDAEAHADRRLLRRMDLAEAVRR